MKKAYLHIFLLCCGFAVQAQSVLKIQGAASGNTVLYVQPGGELYVQGTVNIDQNGSASNASNNYLQNNGTIKIVNGALPGQANVINNVTGLQTFTSGQTTGTVVFAANNETQAISGGGSVGFMNLTVNNVSAPKVNLQEDITVNGTLNIGGVINLQNNNLILSSTGTLAGSPFSTNNMVQADGSGQYIQGLGVIGSNTPFTLPVGDGTPNYTPVNLTFSSNSAAGSVGVNVTSSTESHINTPGPPYVYLTRYWTFSNTLANYNYTGTFTYPSANISNASLESSLKLSQWTGSAWSQFSGSSATSGVLTESTSLTQATAALTGDFTGRTQCKTPAVYIVTGGTNCGSSTVGLSGSDLSVNYQLVLNGSTNVGSPVPGTGNAVSFNSQSAAGTYTVVGTSAYGGCTSNMSGSSVVNAYPTVYNVTGGLCVPADLGLSHSDEGINYYLTLNGVNTGATLPGNNSSLDFGLENNAGVYNIKAVDASTGCSDTMLGIYDVSICIANWTGTSSTDWFDPTNWNPQAIPNVCGVTIIINVGHGTVNQPVISAGSPNSPTNVQVGNVQIASGDSITLDRLSLSVCGNWTAGSGTNAAVISNGTAVIMNSSISAQTISGNSQMSILEINNTQPQGVSITSGGVVDIATGLWLQAGSLDVNAGTLELMSTSSPNNSYIDDFTQTPVPFTGTITGNVIADRYVPVKGSNQHYISSPVNTPAFSQLQASSSWPDGTYVVPSADCDETKSVYRSPYGTVFQYTDGHMPPGGCMLGNWQIRTAGNTENGKGYSAYLTGNSTLALTGSANTGDITIGGLNNSGYPTVNTLQNDPIQSGWNLVGNPYPSALNMTVDRTANGFGAQVQIWQTSGPFSGSWQSAVITPNGLQRVDLSYIDIAPFQAFMVRVDTLSLGLHSYPFYQSERIRTTTVPFYRTASENTLVLSLDYNGMEDLTNVSFNPSATTAFDPAYDANKSDGSAGRPTLYTYFTDQDEWYSINSLPSLTQTTDVPTGLRSENNGTMTITAQGIQSFDPTTYIYLEDKHTGGAWQNLRNGAYTFTTTATDNQQRFVLHFTPPAILLTQDASCDAVGMIKIQQPGSANWNYTLNDNNNITVSAGVLNAGSPVTVSVTPAVYTLTLKDNTGYTVVKTVQVGGSQEITAAFGMSEKTAQVSDNILFVSSTDNVSAYSWDFGDGVTASGKSTSHNYQEEGVYMVKLTVTGEGGCVSSTSQTMTITSKSATGITNLPGNNLSIWSYENRVFVDFSDVSKVDAEVQLYNILGQMLSDERFGKSILYSKDIANMEVAYIIVKVINDDQITTKKVFISNINK